MSVLGEGGRWLPEFQTIRQYYNAITAVKSGIRDESAVRRAVELIKSDTDFTPAPLDELKVEEKDKLVKRILLINSTKRTQVAGWLQAGSPLTRRMYRNTRRTLGEYYQVGLISAPPPRRVVKDGFFDYDNGAERSLYDKIGSYIDRRFAELEQEKPGKGFVMTIYRRGGTSSPYALQRSLERRRDGLLRVISKKALDYSLDAEERLEFSDL